MTSARGILNSLKSVAEAHTESLEVQEIKKEIENKYGVRCEGHSVAVYPQLKFKNVAKFKAKCTGDHRLGFVIISSFTVEEGEKPQK